MGVVVAVDTELVLGLVAQIPLDALAMAVGPDQLEAVVDATHGRHRIVHQIAVVAVEELLIGHGAAGALLDHAVEHEPEAVVHHRALLHRVNGVAAKPAQDRCGAGSRRDELERVAVGVDHQGVGVFVEQLDHVQKMRGRLQQPLPGPIRWHCQTLR